MVSTFRNVGQTNIAKPCWKQWGFLHKEKHERAWNVLLEVTNSSIYDIKIILYGEMVVIRSILMIDLEYNPATTHKNFLFQTHVPIVV